MSKSALFVFCACEAEVDARSRRRGRADSPDRRTRMPAAAAAAAAVVGPPEAPLQNAAPAALPPSLGETMSSSEGGEPTLKCVCGLQGTSLQGEGEKQRMANTCDAKFLYLGKYIIGETGSSGCHYLLQSR